MWSLQGSLWLHSWGRSALRCARCICTSNKSCSCIFIWLLISGISPEIAAQRKKPFFEIQSVDTWEVTRVKRGNFLHCIQKDSLGHEEFIYGEVTAIRQNGVMLRKNRFMKGSGGFVYFANIANIEKVRLVRRSMLACCIAGIILGEMIVIDGIPNAVIHPLAGISAVAIMVHAIKHKRKSLYRNRVPDSVIVVPPDSTDMDGY